MSAPFLVDAPPASPRPYGLLSAAVVTDDASAHFRWAGVEAVSTACIVLNEAADPCDPAVTKQLSDLAAFATGDPFTVYALAGCKAPGGLFDDSADLVRDAFTLAESTGVERAFMAHVLASPDTVDISGGNVFSGVDGVAMLEGYAAANYGGEAILHVPASITTKLAQPLAWQRSGTHLETFQGNIVASGGGYEDNLGPDGTEADAGTAWLYVTGRVSLRRSPIDVNGPIVALNPATNEFVVLAERTYVPLLDCLLAAVQVSTGCCSCDGVG